MDKILSHNCQIASVYLRKNCAEFESLFLMCDDRLKNAYCPVVDQSRELHVSPGRLVVSEFSIQVLTRCLLEPWL